MKYDVWVKATDILHREFEAEDMYSLAQQLTKYGIWTKDTRSKDPKKKYYRDIEVFQIKPITEENSDS